MRNAKAKRARVGRNINSSLPPHIIAQVLFSKLSIAYLSICRQVCTYWNNLILDHDSVSPCSPTFLLCMNDTSDMYCVEFEPKPSEELGEMSYVASFAFQEGVTNLEILDSCNGLLFVYKPIPNSGWVGILNPMTNEYVRLPAPYHSYQDDETFYKRTRDVYRYGFGFSPTTNAYKVAASWVDHTNTSFFDVFDFHTARWRYRVGSVPFEISHGGVYFDGSLYWIGLNIVNPVNANVICRFDLDKERIESTISLFGVVPSEVVCIQPFNGTVYAAVFHRPPSPRIQVLKLLLSCGGEDSWVTDFVIDDMPRDWLLGVFEHLDLIKVFGNGEILCAVNLKSLILYNPETGMIQTLNSTEEYEERIFVSALHSFQFGPLPNILAGDASWRKEDSKIKL